MSKIIIMYKTALYAKNKATLSDNIIEQHHLDFFIKDFNKSDQNTINVAGEDVSYAILNCT